ncbi:hypothetical protein ABZP36_003729 [Zizania latifolia]
MHGPTRTHDTGQVTKIPGWPEGPFISRRRVLPCFLVLSVPNLLPPYPSSGGTAACASSLASDERSQLPRRHRGRWRTQQHAALAAAATGGGRAVPASPKGSSEWAAAATGRSSRSTKRLFELASDCQKRRPAMPEVVQLLCPRKAKPPLPGRSRFTTASNSSS